jgi:hypothetical protein
LAIDLPSFERRDDVFYRLIILVKVHHEVPAKALQEVGVDR